MSPTPRSAKNMLVLAISTTAQPQNYYRAGTLADVKAIYKDAIASANGDRKAIRQLESAMQLYKLNAQPEWKDVATAPSLTATFQSLRKDGLKAVGLDHQKIAETVKGVGAALKTDAPGVGRDLLSAARGGMLEKMKLLGSASALFSKVSGDVMGLKATGEHAIEMLQNRLTGYEGNGIMTAEGQKMVHATFLADPANATPVDLKMLHETKRAAPKPKQP